MKHLAISWPGFTGYMASCFHALARRCSLKIFIESSRYEQRFDGSELEGLDWRRVETEEERAAVESELASWSPDLLLVCGWSTPLAQRLARAKLPGRKVLAFDMPWEWSLRKIVARWALHPRLRHFDAAFVPGVRCARYARWLGFTGSRLKLGSNPSGFERFSEVSLGEGRNFLFVGRFAAEKGLDILLAAYARYRLAVREPWTLDLVGSGDALPPTLPEGVRSLGFVPPADMPRVLAEHACLVLPSRWEPWSVSAAEAMSAGRLTLLSDRCGLTDDVAPTRVVRADDIPAWSEAMVSVTRLTPAARASEGRRARGEMERYSAVRWAERVMEFSGGAG